MAQRIVSHDRPGGPAPASGKISRGRRITVRVLAVLLTLWALVVGVFGLLEIGVMWLPTETLVELFGGDGAPFDDPAYFDQHRFHFFAIGLLAWGTLLTAAAQLRRPERRVGSMLLLVVLATTSLVAFGLEGSLTSWLVEEWLWFAPVVALAALHPARERLVARPAHDRTMLVLAALASVPWLVFAVVNGSRALTRPADDAAADEFWGVVAVLAVALAAAALIGSGERPGWQLPAWYAAVSSVALGVHSLTFPGGESVLWTSTAVGAVLWGLAFAVAIRFRARGDEPA